VTTPNGVTREATQQAIDLTNFQRIRTIARSAGISLEAAGVYHFVVDFRQEGEQEWRNVARIPITVVTTDQLVAMPIQ
jgi:hypothetical protein